MPNLRAALVAAVKAKRAWERLPPEQRKKIVDSAAAAVRKHGPVVAKKVADTAREQGPVVARRLAEAIERARRGASR